MTRLPAMLIACALAATSAGTAAAQAVGDVRTTGGTDGSVMVTRDGGTYTLAVGDVLFDGDIVSTRDGGSATLSAFNCTVELAPAQQAAINPSMCTPGAVVTARSDGTGMAGFGGNSSVWFVPVFGATVIAIAANSDNDSPDQPVSP